MSETGKSINGFSLSWKNK